MSISEIGILSTWPRDLSRGTGVAMALVNLAHALEDAGVDVYFPLPAIPQGTPMGIERTRTQLDAGSGPPSGPLPDVTLAVDVDGYHVPGRSHGGSTVKVLHVRTNFLEMLELCPDYDLENIQLRAWALERNIETADALVTSSQHTLRHLRRHCRWLPPFQAVIPNAIDDGLARALRADTTPRDEVPLVVGYGKALWRKDFATAVAASIEAAERGLEHRLELLVYGVLVPEMEEMISRRGARHITLAPTTSDRVEMARLLRRAWVAIHPAVQEDFGNVYLEAAFAGVPMAAARIGITEEHGIEPEAGRLVEVGDAAGFARAIEELTSCQRTFGFAASLPNRFIDRRWADAAGEMIEFATEVRDRFDQGFLPSGVHGSYREEAVPDR